MIKIEEVGGYGRMLEDLLVENPELEKEIKQRVAWFRENSRDTRLATHPLTKRMTGKWAFSITDDIRIVYEWLGKTTVRFLAIGGHQKAYGRKTNVS